MSFCSKCGAKLDTDAEFCPKCGTPAGLAAAEPERRRKERKPMSTPAILAIILIIIVVLAVFAVAISFFPARTVGPVKLHHSVPRKTGIDTLNLSFTADVAHVNIVFEDLSGEWQSPSIILNASATARVGAFASQDVLDNFFRSNNTTTGNVLTVISQIDIPDLGWPTYSSLNVTCDIRIDPSMNTSLNVRTSVGQIVLNTESGVVLHSLSLVSTTGGVEADLVEAVTIAGNVSIEATTGGVELSWDNLNVTRNIRVDVETTTGGVNVDVKQDEDLLGNVTMKAESTTGGVDFALDIRGDVGAEIESSTALGGVDVNRRVGFSGTEALLQSNNYPAAANFDVNLKTSVGGIDIDTKYIP